MRRYTLPCARLILAALCRRLGGGPRAVGHPTGERRLEGLVQEVWIRRDDGGIPHVFGNTLPDLGFGVGVAMAQDRLWQMETLRRLAFGRLAELAGDRPVQRTNLHMIGTSLLAVDRFYRSLRMQAVSREELALASEEARSIVEGFAQGVNGWVSQCRPRDLPPEFLLAGIDPEPWRPEDCLAIGKLIGWLLSLAYLLTMNPLAAAVGHSIMHIGAVLNGIELPPHREKRGHAVVSMTPAH